MAILAGRDDHRVERWDLGIGVRVRVRVRVRSRRLPEPPRGSRLIK